MKKGIRGLLCFCLALMILAGTVPAFADDSWTCTVCGQTGNWGNYCYNCGAAKPASTWTCTKCGKQGNTGNFCTNCGAAKPTQTNTVTVNSQLEQIPGYDSCVKVRVYSVGAHDYIVGKDPLHWFYTNAVDGDVETCWQFNTSKSGVLGNAWLEMTLASAQTVDALWIKAGHWLTQDSYNNNARPKGIRVEFLYAGATTYTESMEFVLRDDLYRTDWQRLELGQHRNVQRVRIRVMSQYNGAKSTNDVCVSEVMLVQYASASSAMPAGTGTTPIAQGPIPTTTTTSSGTASAAKLLMRLSTRSGPGTTYEDTGTFFQDDWSQQTVKVLGKDWDSRNGIWWVLVDFAYHGTRYRLWTGLKRVDVNVDTLPEINGVGQGTVNATDTLRGPGNNYAKGTRITSWKDVVVFGRENGYLEVEYIDNNTGKLYRAWVPESAASIDWNWNNDANK